MKTYYNQKKLCSKPSNLAFFYAKVLFILFFALTSSCKKFVEIPKPVTEIVGAAVYSTDLSAASAQTGIYNNMMNNPNGLSGGVNSISLLTGMTADELRYYGQDALSQQAYSNTLSKNNVPGFWTELFFEIYQANAVLEGVAKSATITDGEKQQLTGEAKFMRAFLDFYGTNLFGEFPSVTSTDYKVNNALHRATPTQVYQQIISDLQDAQKLLPENFVTPTGRNVTTERVRPNKWAATALLARVYLYLNKYQDAATQANAVISSPLFSLPTDLNSVFLMNSPEAIWQLQPVQPGYNTFDAYYYVLTSVPGNSDQSVSLSNHLISAFEAGDQRQKNWVGSFTSGSDTYYYPYKYKAYVLDPSQQPTEYLMVLRLAEQYLIRAEAEANGANGGLTAAIADLNIIRHRAGLSPYTGVNNQAAVLAAIYHERQVELFSEWGHRWFDLKRTGLLNSVMGSPGNVTVGKGGTWSPDWALFPVPQTEISLNSNLNQNSGY